MALSLLSRTARAAPGTVVGIGAGAAVVAEFALLPHIASRYSGTDFDDDIDLTEHIVRSPSTSCICFSLTIQSAPAVVIVSHSLGVTVYAAFSRAAWRRDISDTAEHG